jgi:hypothetical protein
MAGSVDTMNTPKRPTEVPISVADLWDRLVERNRELEALLLQRARFTERLRFS